MNSHLPTQKIHVYQLLTDVTELHTTSITEHVFFWHGTGLVKVNTGCLIRITRALPGPQLILRVPIVEKGPSDLAFHDVVTT